MVHIHVIHFSVHYAFHNLKKHCERGRKGEREEGKEERRKETGSVNRKEHVNVKFAFLADIIQHPGG